jgi:hypothetical protein
MIFEPRAHDLLAVVEIFRSDEPDDRVDKQGFVTARDRIGARLQRLLVHAMVGVRG